MGESNSEAGSGKTERETANRICEGAMTMAKHHPKKIILCCEPGCEAPRYVYGRCADHFRQMDPALFERLKGMSRKDRAAEFERTTTQPELPRWTYEGDQDALAQIVERKEQEKREEQNNV
jgi:hypothetical protein